jgi:hypothetical protein
MASRVPPISTSLPDSAVLIFWAPQTPPPSSTPDLILTKYATPALSGSPEFPDYLRERIRGEKMEIKEGAREWERGRERESGRGGGGGEREGQRREGGREGGRERILGVTH